LNKPLKAREVNDPKIIQEILSQIKLEGEGFNTDCLLVDIFDAGLDYPDYMRIDGVDSNASYGGKSPAWAKYHVRQGKRVFMVYGGEGKERKIHFTETP
tara:strand:+ start:114 stop:410 length:297 start_codon:yes stop_codon:yes gene_type:complete